MRRSFFRLFGARRREPQTPPQVPAGTRVYAVGDIHGRSDLLDVLHALIGEDLERSPVEKAVIVYVGDYVDRGTDSAGVLDRLCGAPPPGATRVLLKGNHEAMLLRFLEEPETGALWRQYGGMETLLSYRVDVTKAIAAGGLKALAEEFARLLPPSHLRFLQSLKTFATIGDYFFCHAGVRPGAPLVQQREADLLWIRDAFLKSNRCFGKMVVHGHTPAEEPEVRPNRICVDTGAYATHRLTCAVFEGEDRRFLAAEPQVQKAAVKEEAASL
jgi:serine/threonine protein phosphatase 1